jgi:hypothetical protein
LLKRGAHVTLGFMQLGPTPRLCSSTATRSAFASVAEARARRPLVSGQRSVEFCAKAKKQPLI